MNLQSIVAYFTHCGSTEVTTRFLTTGRGFVAALALAGVLFAGLPLGAEGLLTDLDVHWQTVEGERGVQVTRSDGTVLMAATGHPIVENTTCDVALELTPVTGGFDLTIHIENPHAQPRQRPRITLEGFRLSPHEVTWLDPAHVGCYRLGAPYRADGKLRHIQRDYPDKAYSPVMAMHDDTFAVGAALLYRLIPDRHETRLFWCVPRNFDNGTQQVYFDLATADDRTRVPGDFNADGALNGLDITGFKQALIDPTGYEASTGLDADDLGDFNGDRTLNGLDIPGFKAALAGGGCPPQQGALLAPGARQTLSLTVRFAEPDEPLTTLEPYRAHVRALYGPVRYRADRRPILGKPCGFADWVAPDNPRGFLRNLRTDLEGWGPMVDFLIAEGPDKGYERTMIWVSSGLYSVETIYPPEFMTEWLPIQVATLGEFDRLRDAGASVGFWWGRSTHVSAGWNTGEVWKLDIDNPADVAFSYAELDLARRRGAREIGLDSYASIDFWSRYAWMHRIQRDFPELRFITEACDCDVMHVIAPTFLNREKQPPPALLADFLNPGHETWLWLRGEYRTLEEFNRGVQHGLAPCSMHRGIEY
jgi:hypothetical protein